MKRFIFSILLTIVCTLVFAQTGRLHNNMVLRDPFYLDTTSVDFQNILHLWNDYKDCVFDDWMISQDNNKIDVNSKAMLFWEESERQKYGQIGSLQGNPDLFLRTFQLEPTNYFMGKELFIGVEKRNDTLFELRTMFFDDYPTENQLAGVYTIPIIKHSENDYKFFSKLSLLEPTFQSYKLGWLTFMYPRTYNFNETAAQQTFKLLDGIAETLQLEQPNSVVYYLFDNKTEFYHSLGVDVSPYDFIGCSRVYPQGLCLDNGKILFFTKEGETLAHELIHCLIREKGWKYTMFEEGLCSYYGGHALESKEVTLSNLKLWLNENPQIDLSLDLFKADFSDFTNNYSYALQMVVCEMIHHTGGMKMAFDILYSISEGEDGYFVIAKHLGFKKKNINNIIRDYLNKNY